MTADDELPTMSDTMTIVIHLPQPMDKITTLLRALGAAWPATPIAEPGHIEIDSE